MMASGIIRIFVTGVCLALPAYGMAQQAAMQGTAAFYDGDYEKSWLLLGPLANAPNTDDSISLFYAISIIETGREPAAKADAILQELELSVVYRPLMMYGMARTAFLMGEDARSDSLFRLALNLDFEAYYPDIPLRYHYQFLKTARSIEGLNRCRLKSESRNVSSIQSISTTLSTLTAHGQFRQVPEQLRSATDVVMRYSPPAFYHSEASLLIYSSLNEDGDANLYASHFMPGQGWELPSELFTSLNSAYPEYCAWLNPEGDSIWFSSAREGSMGGLDVFVSVLDQVELTWSLPQNIGTPWNSRLDDYLVFPAGNKGEWALLQRKGNPYGLLSSGLYVLDCDTVPAPAMVAAPPVETAVEVQPATTQIVENPIDSLQMEDDSTESITILIDTLQWPANNDAVIPADTLEPEVFLTVWVLGESEGYKIQKARILAAKPGLDLVERRDAEGKIYFTSGVFSDFNEARKHLSIEIQDVAPDARVMALNRGLPVPVIDAIRILKP